MTAKRKLFQSTLFAYTEEIYMNKERIDDVSKDITTMAFIKSALGYGMTSAIDLERNIVAQKPELVSVNNFKKVIVHL